MSERPIRYATAVPRFLWWGFKRASWPERLIVVTGALLLLGLVWPADESDAKQGTSKWADPSPVFEFEGSGWSTLGDDESAYKAAVRRGAAVWLDNTSFDPYVALTEVENDLTWGTLQNMWQSCTRPSGASGHLAHTCIRKRWGAIVEVDIVFNPDRQWYKSKVRGIAAHEFGHAGGLKHDEDSECSPSDVGLYTMCPQVTHSNAPSLWTLTTHDINDMNGMYDD